MTPAVSTVGTLGVKSVTETPKHAGTVTPSVQHLKILCSNHLQACQSLTVLTVVSDTKP